VAIPRTVNGGIEPDGFNYAGALVGIQRIRSLRDLELRFISRIDTSV
jgi:hypothetical protein